MSAWQVDLLSASGADVDVQWTQQKQIGTRQNKHVVQDWFPQPSNKNGESISLVFSSLIQQPSRRRSVPLTMSPSSFVTSRPNAWQGWPLSGRECCVWGWKWKNIPPHIPPISPPYPPISPPAFEAENWKISPPYPPVSQLFTKNQYTVPPLCIALPRSAFRFYCWLLIATLLNESTFGRTAVFAIQNASIDMQSWFDGSGKQTWVWANLMALGYLFAFIEHSRRGLELPQRRFTKMAYHWRSTVTQQITKSKEHIQQQMY